MSYSKITSNPASENGYIVEIKDRAHAAELADTIDSAPAWEVTEVRISFPTNRAYIWTNRVTDNVNAWDLQKIVNRYIYELSHR